MTYKPVERRGRRHPRIRYTRMTYEDWKYDENRPHVYHDDDDHQTLDFDDLKTVTKGPIK
jgi:hypothetical protein